MAHRLFKITNTLSSLLHSGYVSLGRSFFTSSHEKNGNLELVGGSTTTLAFKGFFASDEGLGYTVGEDAVYTNEEFSYGGGTVATTIILTFTNEDKTKASSTYDVWNSAFGDTYFLIGSTRSSLEKISEEEFIDSIQQEFDAQNVPAGESGFIFVSPRLDQSILTHIPIIYSMTPYPS